MKQCLQSQLCRLLAGLCKMHESFVTETSVVVIINDSPRNSKDIRIYFQ